DEPTRPDVPTQTMNVDAIAELWYDDMAALTAAAASPEMKAVLANGALHLSAIKTFLTEEIAMIPHAGQGAIPEGAGWRAASLRIAFPAICRLRGTADWRFCSKLARQRATLHRADTISPKCQDALRLKLDAALGPGRQPRTQLQDTAWRKQIEDLALG